MDEHRSSKIYQTVQTVQRFDDVDAIDLNAEIFYIENRFSFDFIE